MAHRYIANDKASKAKRKGLIVIGNLEKAKAKEFFRKHTSLFKSYGTLLDGSVDVAIPERMVGKREVFERILANA